MIKNDPENYITVGMAQEQRRQERLSASPAGVVKPLTKGQIETLAINIHNVNHYDYTIECLTHHLSARIMSAIEPAGAGVETDRTFQIGDMVRKRSGSWWEGRVVGFYSTEQTPDGVCVQLDKPMGPVQIYPATALAALKGDEQ